MPVNAAWHRQNLMPKRPTTEQRIAWHVEHARECGCRPIPEKLRAAAMTGAQPPRKRAPASDPPAQATPKRRGKPGAPGRKVR